MCWDPHSSNSASTAGKPAAKGIEQTLDQTVDSSAKFLYPPPQFVDHSVHGLLGLQDDRQIAAAANDLERPVLADQAEFVTRSNAQHEARRKEQSIPVVAERLDMHGFLQRKPVPVFDSKSRLAVQQFLY